MKKKFFYVPGVMSVTAVVLLLKFVTVPAFMPVRNEMIIRQSIPSDDAKNVFSGFRLIDAMIKQKKIIHVDLNGDFEEDDKKINFIQYEARRLKYTHDTTGMIEIHLADEITYGRFVELVNIMLKDKHRRYGLWKNSFYIFGEATDKPPTADTIKLIYL